MPVYPGAPELTLSFASGVRLTISRERQGLVLALNDDATFLSRDTMQAARERIDIQRRRAREMGRPLSSEQGVLFRDVLSDEHPHWIFHLPDIFPVLFIEDQRLILKSRPRDRYQVAYGEPRKQASDAAVRRFPRMLRDEIQHGLSRYAAHSQELDRRFPMRVAEAIENEITTSEDAAAADLTELREVVARVSEERKALQRVGLLGTEEGPLYFDDRRLEAASVRPVIRVFAEDTVAKFEILRELRVRLELFTAFLNQHYEDKYVAITRDDGFTIMMKDDRRLRPWELSSGEQQVLALAFEILFASKPKTLILIDEPELSLHVLWQSTLIDDLVAMGRTRNVQFILATHSPTLIGDREELTRSLATARDEWPVRRSDTTDFDALIEFDDDGDYSDDEPQ